MVVLFGTLLEHIRNHGLNRSSASFSSVIPCKAGTRWRRAELVKPQESPSMDEIVRAFFLLYRVEVISPGEGGYSHTLPIRVCAAQLGRDFEAPDLERGIHFRGVF